LAARVLSSNIANGDNMPSVADATDFGSINVSAPADPVVHHTFNIQNLGSTDIHLTLPYVTITGANAGDFQVTQFPGAPTMFPTDNQTFEITFNPTFPGVKTALVSILNDDPNRSPYTFSIQGTGTQDNAPGLTATGTNPQFIANGAAVLLYGGIASTTNDAGQTFTRLDFFVSNLSDGANEIVNADGTAIPLMDGASGTTATNGFHYGVSKPAGTATVSLTKAAGTITVPTMNNLVAGLAYVNTAATPTLGVRMVSIQRLDDSGSNTPPNQNTVSLTIGSNVTVAADSTAATDFFRSNTLSSLGDWTAPGSWQSSHDGLTGWINATAAPTTSASGVTILSNHNISITTAVSFGHTTVQSSGSLVVVEGGGVATVATSPGLTTLGSSVLDVRGSFVNSGSVDIGGQLTAQLSSTFSGTAFTYESTSQLEYDDNARTTGNTEFPAVNGPPRVYISTNSVVTLGAPRTIPTQLTLNTGTFDTSQGLTLSSGCFVLRATGNIVTAPTFGGPVDVEYFNSVTAGPELPTGTTNLHNLTLAGGSINVGLNNSATVNGTLALSSGRINTGANTLSIPSGGSLTRSSGFVIGNLQRTFTAAGSITFDVGTVLGYTPVAVNATAGTFPANFTVVSIGTFHPALSDPTKALDRYWTLTGPGGGFTANLTFNYLDVDIPGTANENNFVIEKYNGTFSAPGGLVNAAANQATINSVSSFSDWTLAEPSAVGSAGTLQFSSATYSAPENIASGKIQMIVSRTGGTTGAVAQPLRSQTEPQPAVRHAQRASTISIRRSRSALPTAVQRTR
jgi:hypothetical protein